MASRPEAVPGVRSVKSCTECKQSKLRCDSKAKFPNPCSRCQARHLLCTVDPGFQRKPARKRLEALTREIQELRTLRVGESEQPRLETVPEPQQAQSEITQDDLELDVDCIAIEEVVIESSLVVSIFTIFSQSYRPHFPLIRAVNIRRSLEFEPLLLWTIIIIVTSHTTGSTFEDIYQRLSKPFSRLLNNEILEAPMPLHRIQSLLLLCVWPLPVPTQPRDPSWLYCGMAIHACRYLGLERQQPMPPLRSLGITIHTAQEGRQTWLGCFQIATSLSMHLGLPPPIHSELDFTTIHSFIERVTILAETKTLLKIQLVVAKFGNLLNHQMDEAASFAVVRLLETELEVLRALAKPEHDYNMVERNVLVARLHFHALLITRTHLGTPSYEITVRTALTIALRIIDLANERKQTTPELDGAGLSPIQQARAMPKEYYRGIAFATIFLLKFFHLRDSTSLAERQTANDRILVARDIFSCNTTDPQDEYSRTARIFDILASLSPDKAEPSRLRLTNRMGVSVLLDALGAASEARGRPAELDESGYIVPDPLASATAAPPGVEGENENDILQDWPWTVDEVNSSLEFLKGFWDDPASVMTYSGDPLFRGI